MMRTIGIVTVARSDYGIYLPILRKIEAEPKLRLKLIVGGSHLLPQFGRTVREIEADGFKPAAKASFLLPSDSPQSIAKSLGQGVIAFARTYVDVRPDILVVLGDRFEMFAAVAAALPLRIPVAHIHGGELTRGAIDDSMRHAMTKLSHLHFVATREYARRVAQLGEESWRIVVSGAPALDNLRHMQFLELEQVNEKYGLQVKKPFLLATFHPVTLEYDQTRSQAGHFFSALARAGLPVVFTMPNADMGGQVIRKLINEFIRARPNCCVVENLGTQAYFSLMKTASAMVGNSSSGIIEAPSFRLPVVNVGTRQAGRVRSANVIDVGCSEAAIMAGIRRAISPAFYLSLKALRNPYCRANAADIIVNRLKTVLLDTRLMMKKFVDS